MNTSRSRQAAIRTASIGDPPRPVRLRRLALLRVLLRPRAAARLLDALAADADMYRAALGVVLVACALYHQAPHGRRMLP